MIVAKRDMQRIFVAAKPTKETFQQAGSAVKVHDHLATAEANRGTFVLAANEIENIYSNIILYCTAYCGYVQTEKEIYLL